jgi:Asp/Glu/hydantoin racemase
MTLDGLLTEIEQLVRAQAERHMAIVIVEPGDDDAVIVAKRAAAIECLGVPEATVDLTVHVKTLCATPSHRRGNQSPPELSRVLPAEETLG